MKTYQPVAPGAAPTFANTKPIYVIDDLADLRGPESGFVILPTYLDWTPMPGYDLSVVSHVQLMYETVLREAGGTHDLSTYLSERLLRQQWHDLELPMFLREMWESIHPDLSCR